MQGVALWRKKSGQTRKGGFLRRVMSISPGNFLLHDSSAAVVCVHDKETKCLKMKDLMNIIFCQLPWLWISFVDVSLSVSFSLLSG